MIKDRLDKLINKYGTLRKLAIHCKIPYNTLYDCYTNGDIKKIEVAIRISEYTGCSLDWLLTGKEDIKEDKLLHDDKENLDKLRKILESDDEGTKKAIRDNVFSFMVSIKRKDILEDLIKKGKLSLEDARLIDADIGTKEPSGLQQPKHNLKQGSAGGQTKNKKAGNDK